MAEVSVLPKIVSYGIFPAIGIGRVGNSDEYFVGPEIPDVPVGAQPGFQFKDAHGKVKKQAARFRVYGYDEHGKVVRELTTTDAQYKVTIEWSVQLANKKASHQKFQGILNKDKTMVVRNEAWPSDKRDNLNAIGPLVTINGNEHGKKHPMMAKIYKGDTKYPLGVDVNLGNAWAEDNGRLIVVGGDGRSNTIRDNLIMQYANNDYWYDDIADGPVSAKVTVNGAQLVPHNHEGTAWFLTAPPKFAPTIQPLINLHQVISETQNTYHVPEKVSYYDMIYPVLESICQIAWVNPKAWKGHNPATFGNFLSSKMQKMLADPDPKFNEVRQNLFQRLRIPQQLANQYEYWGQAYQYYMPALSGNNGDDSDADPTTWLSLSPGQFQAFHKWAKGEFHTTPRTNYLALAQKNKFDFSATIPLANQPDALNYATLQWCIGGAFFPGIEMTFVSYFKENFSKISPFRINTDNHKAGDVSKWMALPWQADFYECMDHWWPTQRPDSALPIETAKKLGSIDKVTADSFADWTRGFRTNEPSHAAVHWGDLDMVQYWSNLGFIVPVPELPSALVETERNFLVPGSGTTPIPKEPSLKDLEQLLQMAMAVELATIPPYLYAMYSIRDVGVGPQVADKIRRVVMEEMLHASLVANITASLGMHVKFYAREMTPFYPNPLPHVNQVDLTINLAKADEDTLETFLKIEAPATPAPVPNTLLMVERAAPVNDSIDALNSVASVFGIIPSPYIQSLNVKSIGELYIALETIMEQMAAAGKLKFNQNPGCQLEPGMGYSPHHLASTGLGLMKIENIEDAKKAMKEIIMQGEGGVTQTEESHYKRFQDALNLVKDPNNKYEVWPVATNPYANGSYGEYPQLQSVATAVDAAYSLLLLSMEKIWATPNLDEKRQLVIGALPTLMSGILAPLSKFLVTQKLGGSDHAGPTFAFYNFQSNGSTPKAQLVQLLQAASSNFPNSGTISTALNVANQLPDFSLYTHSV